ncbi:hypothetical protein AXX17_AT4G18360 [Arabidopsis thaliana]|uniref:Uncharacterized protein n=1 Tax=Arabidopsis thaliana TaxID=3702 RepID=A0A178V0K5_ARATH|nr:hypothetical protein AXX17_AT4G18360 [Arabidopsis thaliana]
MGLSLRHDQKMEYFHDLWRACRGAMRVRCNETRAWIAKVDGIYLVRIEKP